MGPPAATAAPTASFNSGPATARRNRSRSTAAGVSRPNHGTSPGPWLMAEKARVPPSRFSTIHTHADGPMADAMGTTVSWWLAGRSVTSPFSTRAPASSGSPAHPSAITAARIERRSGSHTSAQPIGGPQWRIVRSAKPGTTSAAGARPTSSGTPASSRRTTSALASSMAAARGP